VRTYIDNSESRQDTAKPLDPASACLVIGGLSALSWGVLVLGLYALIRLV
jgi:hypothetical protein